MDINRFQIIRENSQAKTCSTGSLYLEHTDRIRCPTITEQEEIMGDCPTADRSPKQRRHTVNGKKPTTAPANTQRINLTPDTNTANPQTLPLKASMISTKPSPEVTMMTRCTTTNSCSPSGHQLVTHREPRSIPQPNCQRLPRWRPSTRRQ